MNTMTSPWVAQLRLGKSLPILFAVGIGYAATCGGVSHATNDGWPQVRYGVTGSSPVAEYISYQTNTGQGRIANVTLPWSTEFTGFPGAVYVLSAQGEGTITCKILVDGKPVFDAKSSGAPGRTVCSH